MAMASIAIRPQFSVSREYGIEGSIRGKLGACQAHFRGSWVVGCDSWVVVCHPEHWSL